MKFGIVGLLLMGTLQSWAASSRSLNCAVIIQENPFSLEADVITLLPEQSISYGKNMKGYQTEAFRTEDDIFIGIRKLGEQEFSEMFSFDSELIDSTRVEDKVYEGKKNLKDGKKLIVVCRSSH